MLAKREARRPRTQLEKLLRGLEEEQERLDQLLKQVCVHTYVCVIAHRGGASACRCYLTMAVCCAARHAHWASSSLAYQSCETEPEVFLALCPHSGFCTFLHAHMLLFY